MSVLIAFVRRLWVLRRLGAPPALTLRVLRWILRFAMREFAFHYSALDAIVLAVLFATGATGSAAGKVAAGAFALLLLIELRFAWAGWRSAAAVARALADLPREPDSLRFPVSHLLFPPLMLFARSVRHERAIVYHREPRRRVRLDVYVPRKQGTQEELRPAVVQVHGGGWIVGSRVEQGIPLLNHLAAHGWVGFNVDYRLSPRATMPEHVIDVKRAIAWVREHAVEYGVDPHRICITGGSAGGHLCALAALTANDPALQPGFEGADTSVAAAVPFYGLYDLLDADRHYYRHIRGWLFERIVLKASREDDSNAFRLASPTHRVHRGAPPFLVIHGDHDTLVPVLEAQRFVAALERVSENTVRYVELPGAEHAFDVFPSLRTARVVEGIERFLRAAVEPPPEDPGGDRRTGQNELIASPR